MAACLVSASWLKEQLDSHCPDIVVLDVTLKADEDNYANFQRKHIPGARWLNIDKDARKSASIPRDIPDGEHFESNVRAVGVRKESHVVLYDSLTVNCGFYQACRAWWMFKIYGHDQVSVLDGGLAAWDAGGYEMTDEVSSVEHGDFVVSLRPALLTSLAGMKENLTYRTKQVCDTRPSHQFDNREIGHYPGAINLPMNTVLLDHNTKLLKTKAELDTEFARRGIILNKPIVGMCNTGTTCCTMLLAATICGAEDMSIYLGSIKEWSQNALPGELELSEN